MARRPRSAGEPTPGSLADLQPEANPETVARNVVLRRLSAAPRTRHELEDDLLARGIPQDVTTAVLDRFTEVHLIDDESYARMWVESRHRSRGTARSVLRQELRRKGVDDAFIDEALTLVDDEAELVRARALVERKLPSLARYETTAQTRRLMNMLMRRGYSSGVAMSAVRAEMEASGSSGR